MARDDVEMRWWYLAIVLGPGCGRIGFDPRDGASDASSNVDALPVAAPCPSTIALADDFADGVRSPKWGLVQYTGITVSEVPDVLRVAFTTATAPAQFGGYESSTAFDITGGCVTAQLVTLPIPGAYAYLTWGAFGANDKFEIEIDAAQIGWWYEMAGTVTDVIYTPWSPGAWPYVRMHHAPTGFTLEVSADGSRFVVLAQSTVVPFDLTMASVRLGGGTEKNAGGVASDGEIEWTTVQLAKP